MEDDSRSITVLLKAWQDGAPEAANELMPRVYRELKKLARSYLRRERADHTLGATALVNEAYLRLVDQKSIDWEGRAHFFGIAGRQMRRILVDHARKRNAKKRGGKPGLIPFEEEKGAPRRDPDLVALDDALHALEATDPRQAKLVELKYFAGLNISETAEILGISPSTARRDWTFAKAWLAREMRRGRPAGRPARDPQESD